MTPEEHREIFREGWNSAIAAALAEVPTTWLDPLLTGESAVVRSQGDFTAPDIEALCKGIRGRIEQLREGGE